MVKFMYGCVGAFTAMIVVSGVASMTLGSRMGPNAYVLPGVIVLVVTAIAGVVVFLRFPRLFGREDRRRTMAVCVTNAGVTVDQRPGDVFSFGYALGPWIPAGIAHSPALGTALHLQSGAHRFVLGGRDHRIAGGTRLDAPPTSSVDAWMWSADFAALLTAACRYGGLDIRRPAPEEPIRCVLFPNTARSFAYSGPGMFGNARTLRQLQADPPLPGVAIDVSRDAVRLIDLNLNTVIASAWLAQVTATPAVNTIHVYRAGAWSTPIMVVTIPGAAPLTIGCSDSPDPGLARVSYSPGRYGGVTRFSWRSHANPADQPEYLVSGADWLTLAEKFGLAAYLEDNAKR
jgi:hypothetical protein